MRAEGCIDFSCNNSPGKILVTSPNVIRFPHELWESSLSIKRKDAAFTRPRLEESCGHVPLSTSRSSRCAINCRFCCGPERAD